MKTTNGRMRPLSKKEYGDSVKPSDEYMLPTFEVKQSDIPESEEWSVGDDYKIQILVTQKSVRSRNGENYVEFQIKKIKSAE